MNLIEDKNVRERIRKDLLNLVDFTLSDKDTGSSLKILLEHFNVSVENFKSEVLAYNLGKGIDGYENNNYQKIAARLALHFHNIIKGSYHIKRQEVIASFLGQVKPNNFIDVGYGVPAPYLFSYMKENSFAHAVLADQDSSAEEFAQQLIISIDEDFLSRVSFKTYDMDTENYVGDTDTYLYLDSIEHTKNPTEYLRRVVFKARSRSYFIFSLPICSMKGMENFHFIEWLTNIDAKTWLEQAGLRILSEDEVFPNPSVDYFAELIEGGYHNYLVLAQKER